MTNTYYVYTLLRYSWWRTVDLSETFRVLYLLTYLLTPCCRVLLEKLTGLQLFKKFPAFYGTRRFITALTSVRHLSLSWASPIQSTYPHPTSRRSILILSTHLRLGLPSGLFPSGFPTKTLYAPLSSSIRATCPAHLILLDFITRIIFSCCATYQITVTIKILSNTRSTLRLQQSMRNILNWARHVNYLGKPFSQLSTQSEKTIQLANRSQFTT